MIFLAKLFEYQRFLIGWLIRANNDYKKPFFWAELVYRIGANRTALLIITASRVNSNIKAFKLPNLNNTTAS